MAERHKWADVIIAWANGETIQVKSGADQWDDWVVSRPPSFSCSSDEWRIKPRTIMIGDMEVPEPLREYPKQGTTYYVAVVHCSKLVAHDVWGGFDSDKNTVQSGVAHLTRDAAIAHSRALINISGGTV